MDRLTSSKKSLVPQGSINNLKNFPLKFLYEVVKGLNKMLPNKLISDSQLTGVGWVRGVVTQEGGRSWGETKYVAYKAKG